MSYLTLAGQSVAREEIPTDRRQPGYPVPVVLLARLAVELTDAGLPALGVVLDVLDEGALGFYQRFDAFEALSDDPMEYPTTITLAGRVASSGGVTGLPNCAVAGPTEAPKAGQPTTLDHPAKLSAAPTPNTSLCAFSRRHALSLRWSVRSWPSGNTPGCSS